MFRTLEATWDQSARRGWTTIASFTLQALGVSLLLLISLLTVHEPPKLVRRFVEHFLDQPPAPAPRPIGHRPVLRGSEVRQGQIVAPTSFLDHAAQIDDRGAVPAVDIDSNGPIGAIGTRRGSDVLGATGDQVSVIPPAPKPAQTHLLKISSWAEGGVIHKVQPLYPPLARQARIQGAVELRAIIGKTGMIENLNVLGGHAMLVKAAVDAVRQWRYRPYMLNGEPVEVETEITVNFVLSGS